MFQSLDPFGPIATRLETRQDYGLSFLLMATLQNEARSAEQDPTRGQGDLYPS